MTGREIYRKPFEPLLPDVVFLPFGSVEALGQIDEAVAAVICEPIQGEAGIIVPPDEFLPALRKRCDEVGALLILDEVQTGFGRTGKWFAFEHWGIVPDILTVGKALGGGMPLSGFLARREVMRAFAENPPLCHVTTFGGHPVCCASALAALQVMERENLPERAAIVGAKLKDALKQLATRYPLIAEVRGKGLMLGLEFVTKEATQNFVRGCLERGMIVGGTLHTEKVVRIAPPLVITDSEVEWAVEVMDDVLRLC